MRYLALSVLSILTAASCGGTAVSETDGSLAGLEVVEATTVLSPLLTFLGGGYPSANHRLAEQYRLAADCMQQLGWVYEPFDPTSGVTEGPTTYGPLLKWRRQHGFGLATQPNSTNDDQHILESNEAFVVSLDEADQERYWINLFGGKLSEADVVDPASCWGQAEAATPAPITDPEVTAISGTESDAIALNPEMRIQIRAWSACMAERGFEYRHRADPVFELTAVMKDTGGTDEFRVLEIAVAVADLECARTTFLPVQIRLEQAVVERIVTELPEYAGWSL